MTAHLIVDDKILLLTDLQNVGRFSLLISLLLDLSSVKQQVMVMGLVTYTT